jgi:hypothetical protein
MQMVTVISILLTPCSYLVNIWEDKPKCTPAVPVLRTAKQAEEQRRICVWTLPYFLFSNSTICNFIHCG